MRIWYIHPYAGGPGVGRYWRPFEFATEWQRAGHASVVFCASYHHLMEPDEPHRGRHTIDGIPYRFVATLPYVGNRLGRIVSMLMFACSLLWAGWCERRAFGRPDLIVYSSPHPFGFLSAWLMARTMRARIYFEVRDLWPLSLLEIAGVSRFHPLVWLTGGIERFACRRADRIVSLLPCAESHMRAKGMREGRFVWIPNGVSSASLRPTAESIQPPTSEVLLRVEALKEAGRVVFIYAGAHGEPNALHRFLDALSILKNENYARAAFVLVGKGEQKRDLVRRAEREGLDFVYFFGQLPKHQAIAAVQRADVGFFVMHSLPIYRFGVSLNKLYDYMSCSLPVLGAYTAGNDPISEAQCGISVAAGAAELLAAAIKRFCEMSAEERMEMGRRGRLAAEQFYSYRSLAHRYLA